MDLREWASGHAAPADRQRATTCCSTSASAVNAPEQTATAPPRPERAPVIARHAGTVLVGQLAVMAFGVTDTIVAGRYGEAALAALSVGSAPSTSASSSALMGMRAGPAAGLGRTARRARRHDEVGRSVRQGLYLCGFIMHRGHGRPAVSRRAAALDRGARRHAGRGAALPRRAGLCLAAGAAVPHVQHAQPGPGQAAAGDLAADRLRWRSRCRCRSGWCSAAPACRPLGAGGLRLGHAGRQLRLLLPGRGGCCAPRTFTSPTASGGASSGPTGAQIGHLRPPRRARRAGRPGRGDLLHADGAVHRAPGHRRLGQPPDRRQPGRRAVHGAAVDGHRHQRPGALLAGRGPAATRPPRGLHGFRAALR